MLLLAPEATATALRPACGAPESSRRRARGQAACWRGSSSVATAAPLGHSSAPGLSALLRTDPPEGRNGFADWASPPTPCGAFDCIAWASATGKCLPHFCPKCSQPAERGAPHRRQIGPRRSPLHRARCSTRRAGEGNTAPGARGGTPRSATFSEVPDRAAQEARRRAVTERGRGGDRGASPPTSRLSPRTARSASRAPHAGRKAVAVASGPNRGGRRWRGGSDLRESRTAT
jgi:hypothetical protein